MNSLYEKDSPWSFYSHIWVTATLSHYADTVQVITEQLKWFFSLAPIPDDDWCHRRTEKPLQRNSWVSSLASFTPITSHNFSQTGRQGIKTIRKTFLIEVMLVDTPAPMSTPDLFPALGTKYTWLCFIVCLQRWSQNSGCLFDQEIAKQQCKWESDPQRFSRPSKTLPKNIKMVDKIPCPHYPWMTQSCSLRAHTIHEWHGVPTWASNLSHCCKACHQVSWGNTMLSLLSVWEFSSPL